ncbi:protein Wnt-4 isoform X1 [Danaus plexippus]|uniref:protein Wnt-4 isoform X1 n=1 Tax=Danaus plexippus TaxID=13037 RepID=UPI002AB2DE0C|nr:protein Wnt-4 isoform X1 [Danaus plexippus]
MFKSGVLTFLIIFTVSIFAAKNVNGSQPVLQKSIEELFTDRADVIYPDSCKTFRSSARQSKMCKKEPGLSNIILTAKQQALTACEDTFQYDRWNCSLVFNKRPKKSIFKKIYRETAFVHALIAASIAHAVARGCASGNLSRCACFGSFKNTSWHVRGCGDDFKFGKRFTKNFLEWKQAGSDQIAEIVKQDIIVGMDSVGEQMKEICKCHGFSGSCTTKTCWKRLGPFNSAMGLLKKHYHHAVKRKLVNFTTKRAVTPKARKRMQLDKNNLIYLQKTPNLCVSTKGRICKDIHNCATLCCGRGYVTGKKIVKSRCKCKMVDCCFVKCDTCVETADLFTCK